MFLLYKCVLISNKILNAVASDRLRVNVVSFTILQPSLALTWLFSRNQSADGLHLIFERLMLPRVNSGCDRAVRRQLFLVYKIERSCRPFSKRVDTGIGERGNGEKRSKRTPAITAFPRRDSEPQQDETFSLFLLISVPFHLASSPRATHRALPLPLVRVKKRASLATGPVFSGGSNLKGNLCVRKNDRDYR